LQRCSGKRSDGTITEKEDKKSRLVLFTDETNACIQFAAIYFYLKNSLYANSDDVQYGMNSSRDSIFARRFLAGVILIQTKRKHLTIPGRK
jgi:hypothetical protein